MGSLQNLLIISEEGEAGPPCLRQLADLVLSDGISRRSLATAEGTHDAASNLRHALRPKLRESSILHLCSDTLEVSRGQSLASLVDGEGGAVEGDDLGPVGAVRSHDILSLNALASLLTFVRRHVSTLHDFLLDCQQRKLRWIIEKSLISLAHLLLRIRAHHLR